jgi:L-lysine epsilon oxidase-like protein
MSDADIVSVQIHPSIGVARVGNSARDFFFGPECPNAEAAQAGSCRDDTGALKRQAARFRIYGFNKDGQAVRELTSETGTTVTWGAELANKKGAWYRFDTALDVPNAAPAGRRNADIRENRERLVVRPAPRTIVGTLTQGSQYRFDDGSFLGVPVPLGELQTDDKGRLIVLGGHGNAYTPTPWNVPNSTTNNDQWCDDTSDGPVKAQVRLRDGRVFYPHPSWVIIAPPNYAPGFTGFVTLFDVVESVTADWQPGAHDQVSFAKHVFPLLQRLISLQWVNLGFLHEYGLLALHDLSSMTILTRLADKTERSLPLRKLLFNKFRNPDYPTSEPQAIPPIYGDIVSRFPPFDKRQWLSVTPLQYQRLRAWSEGNFDPDVARSSAGGETLEGLPIAMQPHALDRAALDECLGGPFHPGIEVTWPMRQRSMYVCPFRLRVGPGHGQRDFGDVLTPEAALAEDGPLCGSTPGDITRWLAVPWHTDTMTCRAGYDPSFDRNLPTFWPARVPNHVITEELFAILNDPSKPTEDRIRAFEAREDWLRHLDHPNVQEAYLRIISEWSDLGIMLKRHVRQPEKGLPSEVFVETGNRSPRKPAPRSYVYDWTFEL